MLDPRNPKSELLACLPESEFQRLSPYLELVSMELSAVVFESGVVLSHAYFPIDCIISLLCVMDNGDSAEIAMVGNEGVAGVSLFMGGQSTTSRAIVQSGGNAFRLKMSVLSKEFENSRPMQHLFLRYTQALMTQITQTAACNLHHSVDQQLCRWLLMSLDRLPESKVQMTEGLIANMLGVRRAGGTDAVGKLQQAGLVHHRGGMITVIDRPGMERYACECYEVVTKEFNRLLPDVEAV